MIGCTTLPAVSGILRTQAGRRGSGPGRWAGRNSAVPHHPRRATCGSAWRAHGVVTSATAPGPPCGRARCHPHSLRVTHGRRRALPVRGRIWMSAGLPVGATDRRHDRHGRPRKGRPWGGVRAGAAAGGSPSVPFKGLRARGAGPITGTSAGLECCVHQIASSVRLRRLGLHRVGRSLDTVPPSRLGPVGRSSWAAIRPGRVQWALVPGPPDAHGGRVLVSRPVALHLAAGGDSTGASPAQPEPDSDAAGQGSGRRWIGGPAPGWTGDSESAARLAVSSQGEGARR